MPFVDTLCCASGQGLTIGTDQHCTAWCFHVSVMEVMRDAFHARLLSGLKSVGETRRLNSKRSQARLKHRNRASEKLIGSVQNLRHTARLQQIMPPKPLLATTAVGTNPSGDRGRGRLNPIRYQGKFLYLMHRRRYGPQKLCSNAPNNSEQWSLSPGLPLQLKASLTFCIQGLDALLENLQ